MTASVNWQKSSYSGGGDGNECVELSAAGGSIRLRESDDPDTVLATTAKRLAQLLHGVKSGRLGTNSNRP